METDRAPVALWPFVAACHIPLVKASRGGKAKVGGLGPVSSQVCRAGLAGHRCFFSVRICVDASADCCGVFQSRLLFRGSSLASVAARVFFGSPLVIVWSPHTPYWMTGERGTGEGLVLRFFDDRTLNCRGLNGPQPADAALGRRDATFPLLSVVRNVPVVPGEEAATTNGADRGTEDQGFARNKKRRLVQVRRQDAFKPDETAGGSSALLLLASTKRRGAAAHVDAAPDRRACLQPVDQGRGQRAGHDEHPHLRHAGVRPARQDVGRVALQGHGVPRELRQGEERHPAAPRPGSPRRRRRAGPAAGGDVRRGRGQEG
ncbi:hypothetical protein THAOC_34686, partial [Thalassiosira oceanica]